MQSCSAKYSLIFSLGYSPLPKDGSSQSVCSDYVLLKPSQVYWYVKV